MCRLKKYVGRLVADRRAKPAHDSGQADSTTVVGDDKGIVIDHDFLFVEQRELLALLCQPRPDGALHAGRVIGMQGLPQFEHDVIGNVDYRRNPAQAGASQAFDHPLRRFRGRINIPDQPAGKTRAAFGQWNFDRQSVVDRGRYGHDVR
jgi:hypothetical protein